MQTKKCAYCGKEFTPVTKRARFHSDKCRVYYWREKKKEPQSLTLTSAINRTLTG
jgi:ribosomal protein L24E